MVATDRVYFLYADAPQGVVIRKISPSRGMAHSPGNPGAGQGR